MWHSTSFMEQSWRAETCLARAARTLWRAQAAALAGRSYDDLEYDLLVMEHRSALRQLRALRRAAGLAMVGLSGAGGWRYAVAC